MMEQKQTSSKKKARAAVVTSPAHSTLTRDNPETSMIRWAYTKEGPIAGHFITGLIGHGAVLDALASVAESMQAQPNIFDDDVAMVQTAWMNFRTYGSPGFPVSSASTLRDYLMSVSHAVEEDYEE